MALTVAGMLIFESTAVSHEGRIIFNDHTLCNKDNENALKATVNCLRNFSEIPMGLQVSHAGRNGSAHVPWVKDNAPLKLGENAWETVAPSSIKRTGGWPKPKSLTINQINEIVVEFKNAALRAKRIGFNGLEIHMAHGYLLH